MHEDARELGAGAIEDHAAFAEEGAGMDLAAAVAESAGAVNADGLPGERGQAAVKDTQGTGERGIVDGEEQLIG
jgi:hypothetical protein